MNSQRRNVKVEAGLVWRSLWESAEGLLLRPIVRYDTLLNHELTAQGR